jgi:hypothetical protein
MIPKPAETVVYRHACTCKSASQLPRGDEPEHRFDVDGERFPWYMAPEGPRFTRLMDDLYRVDLTIYGLLNDDLVEPGPVVIAEETFADHQHKPLRIAEREFPWEICAEGFTYHRSYKTMPEVRLGFFVKSVDTDGVVTDLREPAL